MQRSEIDRIIEENLGSKNQIAAIYSAQVSESGSGDEIEVTTPVDGQVVTRMPMATAAQVDKVIKDAEHAFQQLRSIPAPRRGEFVRVLGQKIRQKKTALAELITLECGKILQESLGEVQEVIDICDFAVGLSRQLHGLTIVSERPGHRMMEQWHPLGPVAVISAFNFPMAVWSWNAMLAIVCGDSLIWKPSEKSPLCALACQKIINDTLAEFDDFPRTLSSVIVGDAKVGEVLTQSPQIPLVSATGSVPMGKKVAAAVGARLGRSLLELGGNNGMIVMPSARLDLALRAIVFAAVGTCGQRCTTLRRLIVHESLAENLVNRLQASYQSLAIGNPFDDATLIGPLIDEQAFEQMQQALRSAQQQGGEVVCGGQAVQVEDGAGGFYVRPAIVKIDAGADILQHETFAPILYVVIFKEWDEAISIHNNVPQGLSSAVFTSDMQEAERFVSPDGSDCGMANVNIGTSGAEIGGAFGGEKETGGGRESGSDAWRNYMRRTTNTINYGDELPLAQGIVFD